MAKCDDAAIGAMCEGDGECGTDNLLDNCGYAWDAYRAGGVSSAAATAAGGARVRHRRRPVSLHGRGKQPLVWWSAPSALGPMAFTTPSSAEDVARSATSIRTATTTPSSGGSPRAKTVPGLQQH